MTYKTCADAVSMGLSIVCVIHCLLLPLFFTSLPFLGFELLENKVLEGMLVLFSVLVGGYAVRKGYIHFHLKRQFLGSSWQEWQ